MFVVPTVVVVLCTVVLLAGGIAELRDTVRAGRAPALVPASGAAAPGQVVPEDAAPERTVAPAGRWRMLTWFGTAALAVLATASIANRQPDIDDLTFAVLVLGVAGDRAFYLVRRRRAGVDAGLWGEVLSLVVGALGVVLGLTI